MERKRIVAAFISLVMLAIVLFSAFYIAAESGHHCEHEDCPICICLRQCENALNQLGTGIVAHCLLVIPMILALVMVIVFMVDVPEETLVSRKIRLDD